jgi:collagenase-like PrtC family protease
MGYKVKYDVGTNFDGALLSVIESFNGNGQFDCIFGKLKTDMFGGGRSSMILPELTLEQLRGHVDLAHQKGLKFNYLMNPYCLANKEVFPEDHREIIAFLDQIAALGVDGVTVNSPLLCTMVKRRHPRLEITIGLYSSIFTPKQVVEWRELGADVLTLAHALNREFPMLEAMMETAKEVGMKLRLIANNICLRDCAYKTFHGTELAHSSQRNEKGSEFVVDYCTIQCTRNKLLSPEKVLASEWIRPEDVVYYEELCDKVGFEGLSIKLLDRIKSTEFLARVVKAYAERSYPGNLLDIMSFPGEGLIKHSLERNIANTMKFRFNPMAMVRMGTFFALPKLKLDNAKLDGFLERFAKGFSCTDKICTGRKDSVEEFSGNCGYCLHWADKALSWDNSQLAEWEANADLLLESMKDSSMFTFPV